MKKILYIPLILLASNSFASSITKQVQTPSFAMEVSNYNNKADVLIGQVGEIDIMYSPAIYQVYFKNISPTQTYTVSYTYRGNDQQLGNIPYTAVTPKFDLVPGKEVYISSDGL